MRLSHVGRALLILGAVLMVPACSTQKRKNPPVITFTSPTTGGVPLAPVIYIRYDRALDQSTIPGRFVLADTNGTIGCTVTYNPNLFEIQMVPGTVLASNMVHQVTILAGIKSTEGAEVTVNLFFQFTTATATDGTRPSSPTGLSAVGGSITQTGVTLQWTNSTDNVGVDHYDVFMALATATEDFTARLQVGATPQPITGLAAGTTYFFVVRAVDAVGNTDLNTTELVVTTLP